MKYLMIAALVLLAGCTDPTLAERVLRQNGYTSIKITGVRAFMCGRGDSFWTGFEATGPTGLPITGAVCSAWFAKGATLRFD